MNIITSKKTANITIKLAQNNLEVKQCKNLIKQVYYQDFNGVTLSDTICDPAKRIELYPQYYLMGLVGDQLVAVLGLYTEGTNGERHGKVTPQEIAQLLQKAGVLHKYSGYQLREVTKFVVKKEWRGQGIGKIMFGAAHSQDFIQINESRPTLLVSCSSVSIFNKFSDGIGIRSRTIKPMPYYEIHKHYSSAENPVETRLIIPELDIPEYCFNVSLPTKFSLDKFSRKKHILK